MVKNTLELKCVFWTSHQLTS